MNIDTKYYTIKNKTELQKLLPNSVRVGKEYPGIDFLKSVEKLFKFNYQYDELKIDTGRVGPYAIVVFTLEYKMDSNRQRMNICRMFSYKTDEEAVIGG